jgi:SAM-dependent methyltransferase
LLLLVLGLTSRAADRVPLARPTGTNRPPALNQPPTPLYETRSDHDPEGTGTFFLGREIAHVMGHQGVDWLERPEREREEQPDRAVQALRLAPGAVVADIGAGSGYFTHRLARAVGPTGRVFAVDIQPEMLERLGREMKARGVTNVVPVLGAVDHPNLAPASVDLVLMVDVYHELSAPFEMLQAIVKALKPGGRVAFIEYRAEDPRVPIKPLHKMTEAQVRKEAAVHSLEWVETVRSLPWQHLIIFRRPAEPGNQSPRKDRAVSALTPRWRNSMMDLAGSGFLPGTASAAR